MQNDTPGSDPRPSLTHPNLLRGLRAGFPARLQLSLPVPTAPACEEAPGEKPSQERIVPGHQGPRSPRLRALWTPHSGQYADDRVLHKSCSQPHRCLCQIQSPHTALLVPTRRPLPISCPPPAPDSRPQYPRHALSSAPPLLRFASSWAIHRAYKRVDSIQ